MAMGPIDDDARGMDALACDGGIVTLRPVRPGDRAALAGLYGGASPESLRQRFFIPPGKVLIAAELHALCRPGTTDRLTVVALDGADLIAVATCVRVDPASRVAGVAALVTDAHQGRGIGTLLLEYLAARALRAGVTEFVGDALPGNAGALRMMRDFHPHARTVPRVGAVRVDVDLTDQEPFLQAVDARDRTAERASLRPLLAPRSVAVVGAGQRRGTAGHETLRALRDYGFRGRLYAVNASARPVCGVPAHRSVADLPEPVDLVILAVRPDLVPDALAAAGRRGARAAVVLSKGFSVSAAQPRRSGDVLRAARRHSMRLVGPGSLGVIGTRPATRLHACLSPVQPPAGGLAVAVQSGAVGVAVLEYAAHTDCGISDFVSLGEELDVSCDDLMAYWYDDPDTRAVALHLDFPGNPGRFARTVRALGRRKPVLAIGTGTTSSGSLFAQAGVIRTASIDELVDTARMLVGQPLPAGLRTAIVGNAGGLISLAAGNAASFGLTLAPLSPDTRGQLPPGSGNPVTLPVDTDPASIADAADILAGSDEIDILLLMIVVTRATVAAGIMSALGEVADNHPHLTMVAVLSGSSNGAHRLGDREAPVFSRPDQALRALAHVLRYAAWQRQPLGRYPDLAGIRTERARSLIEQATAVHSGSLPPGLAAAVLDAYGVTVRPVSPVAATELSAEIGPDPMFGPVIRLSVAGAGIAAERLLPLTDLDANRLWWELCEAIRSGGHGDPPPVDVERIEDVLVRLSRLAEDHPEIAEIELAPLFAGPAGVTAAAARIRLAGAGAERDPVLRRLSPAPGPNVAVRANRTPARV